MNDENQYDNRARVPEHPQILAGWAERSAAWRGARADHAELDLAYAGDSDRTALDVFWPGRQRDCPVVLFIHGGYWQALDRKSFSFLAKGADAHGVAMAIPSYDLCPDVDIATITRQMRAACLWLYRRLGRRFAVAGHSAGGHLTAELLATDWAAEDAAAPVDLVRHGLAVSGVFDLVPLIDTGLNAALRLDRAAAERQSPILRSPPPDAVLDTLVGAEESREFLRQSRDMAARWGAEGAETRYAEIAGANHFTAIAPLADPGSAIARRLVDFARLAAAL